MLSFLAAASSETVTWPDVGLVAAFLLGMAAILWVLLR